jgi:hypothetical protein
MFHDLHIVRRSRRALALAGMFAALLAATMTATPFAGA